MPRVFLRDFSDGYDTAIIAAMESLSDNAALRPGLRVPRPRLLADETDLFISMPVPKVHVNTVLSGAIKNQWGVI